MIKMSKKSNILWIKFKNARQRQMNYLFHLRNYQLSHSFNLIKRDQMKGLIIPLLRQGLLEYMMKGMSCLIRDTLSRIISHVSLPKLVSSILWMCLIERIGEIMKKIGYQCVVLKTIYNHESIIYLILLLLFIYYDFILDTLEYCYFICVSLILTILMWKQNTVSIGLYVKIIIAI